MSPSVAVPGEKRNAEKAWQVWRYYHSASAEDAHAAALALYDRGYRDCLADVTDFAGLHAAIHRLADLLEASRQEQEAIRMVGEELELGDAWGLSNATAEEHAIDLQEQEELPF